MEDLGEVEDGVEELEEDGEEVAAVVDGVEVVLRGQVEEEDGVMGHHQQVRRKSKYQVDSG